jgi:hypothetical protein
MRAKWQFWVELFGRKEAGTTLALLRIGVACVILYSLLSIAAADLVRGLWIHRDFGGMHPHSQGNYLLSLLGGPTPSAIWGLWAASLVAALAMLLGLGGRWTVLLLQQCYVALFTINSNAYGGYDLLHSNGLWLLFLSQCTTTLSLDCRIRNRSWRSDDLVSAWPRYLFIFQLLLMYFWTGVQKHAATWTPMEGYSALYYVFQDPNWLRWELGEIAATLYPLTQIATAITWHWEQLGPPAVLLYFYFSHTRDRGGRLRRWFTRWDLRVPFVAIGITMHVNILMFMNVGPFSWISMVYYLAFLSPEQATRLGQRVRQLTLREAAKPPTMLTS